MHKTFCIVYDHSCHCSLDVRKCQGDTGTTGNLFVVAFSLGNQSGCHTVSCRRQILADVYSHTETIHRNMNNLPILFTNGQTVNVDLIFCSFGLVNIGTFRQLLLKTVNSPEFVANSFRTD